MRRLALLGLLVAGCRGSERAPELVDTLEAQRPAAPDPTTASRRTAIVEASERVSPAVVSITVTAARANAPQTPFDF